MITAQEARKQTDVMAAKTNEKQKAVKAKRLHCLLVRLDKNIKKQVNRGNYSLHMLIRKEYRNEIVEYLKKCEYDVSFENEGNQSSLDWYTISW